MEAEGGEEVQRVTVRGRPAGDSWSCENQALR